MEKLPLPFTITEPVNAEAVQGNFEHIAKQFPLSRKAMAVETPVFVGATNAPAFQNGWTNYDTTAFRGARYWKDANGIVRIEGLIKSGTVPATIFILPAGYRPGSALIFAQDSNTGHARVDVTATGNVFANSGGNGYFSINCSFKQES